MSIEELLTGTPHRWVRGHDGTGVAGIVDVTDVTHDSRSAGPGAVFVAIRGMKTDGLRFVPDRSEERRVGKECRL